MSTLNETRGRSIIDPQPLLGYSVERRPVVEKRSRKFIEQSFYQIEKFTSLCGLSTTITAVGLIACQGFQNHSYLFLLIPGLITFTAPFIQKIRALNFETPTFRITENTQGRIIPRSYGFPASEIQDKLIKIPPECHSFIVKVADESWTFSERTDQNISNVIMEYFAFLQFGVFAGFYAIPNECAYVGEVGGLTYGFIIFTIIDLAAMMYYAKERETWILNIENDAELSEYTVEKREAVVERRSRKFIEQPSFIIEKYGPSCGLFMTVTTIGLIACQGFQNIYMILLVTGLIPPTIPLIRRIRAINFEKPIFRITESRLGQMIPKSYGFPASKIQNELINIPPECQCFDVKIGGRSWIFSERTARNIFSKALQYFAFIQLGVFTGFYAIPNECIYVGELRGLTYGLIISSMFDLLALMYYVENREIWTLPMDDDAESEQISLLNLQERDPAADSY